MAFFSPLRYPGGKGDLANFMKLVYRDNDIYDAPYVEVYAGGAGIALSLLLGEYTTQIHINDLDRSVYSFWYSVLNETDSLCKLIEETPVTIDEWYRQRAIQCNIENNSLLALGFSTFFLNRTNRSGIIRGGVIGGQHQDGPYKLDARYNRQNLIERIRRISRLKHRINLYNLDAEEFISNFLPNLPKSSLVYLDPPYYIKGQGLYQNYYTHDDHQRISELMKSVEQQWIVSYDFADEIISMYKTYRRISYKLSYSAAERYKGSEVIFFSNGLNIPIVETPANVDSKYLYKTLFPI
jgi:DNA adenine methylase